jgi:hypothetical protein
VSVYEFVGLPPHRIVRKYGEILEEIENCRLRLETVREQAAGLEVSIAQGEEIAREFREVHAEALKAAFFGAAAEGDPR